MSNPIFHSQYTAAQIEASIGKSPRINSTTHVWEVWDIATSAYVSTGVVAESAQYAAEAEDYKDLAYAYEQQALSHAGDASAAKTAAEAAADTAQEAAYSNLLLAEEIPDTVQTYTFSGGSVTQVLHSRNGSAVRTDAFTYGSGVITETRTLATGESLTITTNLTTLETTVVYAAAA